MKQKPKPKAKPRLKPVRFGRWKRTALCCAAVLAALGVFALHLNGNTVHIRAAEVTLSDLPADFDGTTILFVTDLDVANTSDLRRLKKLFAQLQTLRPDALILCGDLTAQTPLGRLNHPKGTENSPLRGKVFDALSDFVAPMGKYFLRGDEDGDIDALKMCAMGSGFTFIDGDPQLLRRGNSVIGLAGISAGARNASALAACVESDACVIAVMNTPDEAAAVRICEAKDGGSWADLLLSGHTHGGLIRVGKFTSQILTLREMEHPGGWSTDAMQPLLVSSGAGTDGRHMRLGTQSEVWLLRLRCETDGEGGEEDAGQSPQPTFPLTLGD